MQNKYTVPVVLTVLALLIFLSGWGNYYLLEKDASRMLVYIERIEEAVRSGTWPTSQKHLRDMKKTWDNINRYWPMLVHHQEMDRIEESMNKLEIYLQQADITQALAELYNLRHCIKHIPAKEAFNLQNIF